jgi:hypothetical protein
MKHSARQWETIAELRVRIVENMFIHHNKRKSLEVAECAYGILSGASLPESNFNGSLSPKSEHPWVVRENFPESSKLEIELFFNAHLFLRPCDGGLQ